MLFSDIGSYSTEAGLKFNNAINFADKCHLPPPPLLK